MLFERKKYLKEIQKYLENKNALILVWARQVWKSSILKMLIDKKYVNNEIFISWDELYLEKFSPVSFYEYLDFRFNLDLKETLIIDEAQKIENIWILIKYIVDKNKEKNLNLKVILSWSWSLEIFRWITDSLIWRYDLIKVNTFSFEEFLEFNWINITKIFLENISEPILKEIQKYFEIYKTFWGYPEVIKAKTIDEKKIIFKNIYTDYLYKDIWFLLKEDESIYFEKFLKLFVTKIWSLIKAEQIISELWIKKKLYKKFIKIIDSSFLFSFIEPFFDNIWNDIKLAKKWYMLDIGYINYILWFNDFFWDFSWKLIENFVYNELCYLKKDFEIIKFWQNKNGTEVDFLLLDNFSKTIIPVEVKSWTKDIIPKSLMSFLLKYEKNIDTSIITNSNFYKFRKENEKKFYFIPYILLFKYFS